jgi:ketosteroid isomerase-like protein
MPRNTRSSSKRNRSRVPTDRYVLTVKPRGSTLLASTRALKRADFDVARPERVFWFETSCPKFNPEKKSYFMKLFTPLLVITLLGLAAAPCAHAQETAADSSAVQANLKQMEDAWVKALVSKDQTAVANMIADDFAGFNPEGKHVAKSQLLDAMKNEPNTLSSATNDNLDVHVYGPNLATVSGTTTEKGKDKHGKEFTRSYVWVDTWMERNGKWQCIAEGVMESRKKK